MATVAKNGRHNGDIREVSAEESRKLFDDAARYYVQMSGEDFLRLYDAGEFDGKLDENPGLRRMKMMIPFGRQD